MKGYPDGYPDPANRHQVATAERHERRRGGRPATPADIARIEDARFSRSVRGSVAQARDAREADLKRRQGLPLSPRERALLAEGV